jgi:hypothetical protein
MVIAKDRTELKNQPIGKRKDLTVNLYTNWEDQSLQVSKFLSFDELHLHRSVSSSRHGTDVSFCIFGAGIYYLTLGSLLVGEQEIVGSYKIWQGCLQWRDKSIFPPLLSGQTP